MRETVLDRVGQEATVDAACIIANFQRMVRIADSTGISLDEPVLMMTQGIREDLGINQFNSAANSPTLPLGKRIAGRLMSPFTATLMKRLAARRVGQSEQ